MINIKFIPVLQSLSKDEFKKFGKFLRSPYFNTNEKVSSFYDELKPYHPAFSSRNLTKGNLFAKVYPGKKYSANAMEKLGSEILRQAESFIMLEGINKDQFAPGYYLLHELNERKLFKHYKGKLKQLESKFDAEKIYGAQYFLNRHRLEGDKIQYLNSSQSAPFFVNDNAQKIADSLTNFFLISILRVYSYMINQSKNAYDHNFRLDFLEQVKSYIESNSFKNIPYIEMFYNSVMLLLYGKDENFKKLRQVLSANFDKVDKVERMNMYTVLTNYCFRQYNLGRDEYMKIDFEIYNEILKNRAYEANDYLHHLHYKNIVSCALRLKKFEWTEKFIKSYKDKLLDEHKLSSYFLCSALLDFVRGSHEKALEHLTKVNMEDITYKFDTKCLMTQIYYELGEFDAFYSMLDTYKHLLTKNKLVPARIKEQHLQFIRFIQQIDKARENNDGFAAGELKKEVNLSESVKNKRWLLEKISIELNKK